MSEVQRRYDAELDIVVRLAAIDPERAGGGWDHSHKHGFIDAGVSRLEYVEKQQRLYERLLGNADALDLWLRNEVLAEVENLDLEEYRIEVLDSGILEPVLASMPETDRDYFAAAIARNAFYECIEGVFDLLGVRVMSLSIVHASDIAPTAPGTLVERRYRVVIDVAVDVSRIDPLRAEVQWRRADEMLRRWHHDVDDLITASAAEYARLQQTFLDALVRNEPAFGLWVEDMIVGHLGDRGAEDVTDRGREDDILEHVIATLAASDRAYFKKAAAKHVLYECTESLYTATTSSLEGLRITYVPSRLQPA